MKNKSDLTADFVRSILDYNPETGIFTWKMTRSNRAMAGSEIKYKNQGYYCVVIDKKLYRCHRLAWLIMTGKWPEFEIDHRNGIRSNNRWSNIREATRLQNSFNTSGHKNSKSGAKGVSWHSQSNKWRARIFVNKKEISLGLFDNKIDAISAYKKAAEQYHGDFRRVA